MTRIKAIRGKSDLAAEFHHVFDGVLETFGQVRGPFSMLLHSPKLAERLLPLVHFFRSGTTVEGKDLSLAILVAARAREGAYVWSRQVDLARRNGVREEVIDLIRRKATRPSCPRRSGTSSSTPASSRRRIGWIGRRSRRYGPGTTNSGWWS
jgi:alkylhydroperoxidase family enzyme